MLAWKRAIAASAALALVSSNAPSAFALDYVALGDSIAVGAGDGPQGGYVGRYRTAAAGDLAQSVALQNLAVGGSTSSDLLTAVTTDAPLRAAVSGAQLVTLDIGGNDFLIAFFEFAGGTCGGADGQDCLRNAVAGFETNWPLILAELRALNPGAMMRTMTYYNPFVVDQSPGDGTSAVAKAYIAEVNETIRAEASAFGIAVADVAVAFNGASGTKDPNEAGYVDPDHIHPSPSGHAVIAELFREIGYAPIAGTLIRIPSTLGLRDDVDAPVDPSRRKLTFKTSTRSGQPPGARVVVPQAGGPQDPRISGATLTLYNAAGQTTDHVDVPLSASGWSLSGADTYRYSGTGAVERIILRAGSIKLKGGGAALAYTLDEASQGAVAVRLTLAGGGWCASAAAKASGSPPSTTSNDRPGKFTGQPKAPAPVTCPPDGSGGTTTTTTVP